jgi:hypothetical protein
MSDHADQSAGMSGDSQEKTLSEEQLKAITDRLAEIIAEEAGITLHTIPCYQNCRVQFYQCLATGGNYYDCVRRYYQCIQNCPQA